MLVWCWAGGPTSNQHWFNVWGLMTGVTDVAPCRLTWIPHVWMWTTEQRDRKKTRTEYQTMKHHAWKNQVIAGESHYQRSWSEGMASGPAPARWREGNDVISRQTRNVWLITRLGIGPVARHSAKRWPRPPFAWCHKCQFLTVIINLIGTGGRNYDFT